MGERLHKTVRTPSRAYLRSWELRHLIRSSSVARWALLAYSILILEAQGQTVNSASSQTMESPSLQLALPQQTDIQSFQTEQQVLAQGLGGLSSQGATPQQIQAWQQANANQQQFALNLAAESEVQPMTLMALPNIPVNTSQTMKDFLTTQVALANARAQIHNQLLYAMPAEVSGGQISQMELSEIQLFQQQHANDLQVQQQRAQPISLDAAQQPMLLPPSPRLPNDASPQLTAFLFAKNQLLRDEMTVFNQYTTATPEARNAALQQWREQNASRFQQLQSMAQQLPTTTSNPEN